MKTHGVSSFPSVPSLMEKEEINQSMWCRSHTWLRLRQGGDQEMVRYPDERELSPHTGAHSFGAGGGFEPLGFLMLLYVQPRIVVGPWRGGGSVGS